MAEHIRRISHIPRNNSNQIQIKHNLTGNKFGHYIEREQLERRIVEYLENAEQNYLLLSGLGGLGKSCLVYSVLSKIIGGDIVVPNKIIDSVIWISDSYSPGNLNLKIFVDSINNVYETVSSTHHCGDLEQEKKKAFDNLNGTQDSMSILVIDNFETIQDEALRLFVFSLPKKCKVIMTCKLSRNICVSNGIIKVQNEQCICDIPVPTFSSEEWKQLFSHILKTNSLLQEWSRNFDNDALDNLIEFVRIELSGIPFPLERILMQIAEYNLFEQEDIRSLIHAVIEVSGDYERIILFSWNKLDEQAKAVLLAAALNGHSSDIDLSLVSKFTNLDHNPRMPFVSKLNRAIMKCLNCRLIEKEQTGSTTRYYLQKIVYQFIVNQIENNEDIFEEFNYLFENWIGYYISISEKIGFCYNDTKRMKIFDDTAKRAALFFVLDFCYSNKRYAEYIKISYNLRYFFYTRAIWETGENCIHIRRAIAANRINDDISELDAYIYYINIASKYNQLDGIDEYISIAKNIISKNNISKENEGEIYFRFCHAMGLYYYCQEKNEEALKMWDGILTPPVCTNSVHDIDAAKRWRMKCLRKTAVVDIEQIMRLLEEAREHCFDRAVVDYTLIIVRTYVRRNEVDKAREYIFDITLKELVDKTNDVIYMAEYYIWCGICSQNSVDRDMDFESAKKIIIKNNLYDALRDDIKYIEEKYGYIIEVC